MRKHLSGPGLGLVAITILVAAAGAAGVSPTLVRRAPHAGSTQSARGQAPVRAADRVAAAVPAAPVMATTTRTTTSTTTSSIPPATTTTTIPCTVVVGQGDDPAEAVTAPGPWRLDYTGAHSTGLGVGQWAYITSDGQAHVFGYAAAEDGAVWNEPGCVR